MDESVVVYADIDERAEVDYVSHRAGQFHALFKVLKIHQVCAEYGRGKIRTDISAGL